MLTFLRKVRRSLIESGSTQKYILYAIGEIALVVIGILIALQINNWNEWKKDRILEGEILNDLAENLFRNEKQLQNSLMIIASYDNSAEIILNALKARQTYSDTLNNHFFHSRYNGSIFVNISKDG